jgi:hypothetical protein
VLTVEELYTDLDRHAIETTPARGDEHALHVADITGCDRATYARIVFGDQEPVDRHTAYKFELGNQTEAYAKAAHRHRNWQMHSKVVMYLDWDGLHGRFASEDEIPDPDTGMILGHPDAVATDAVIEFKSTEFFQIPHPPWSRKVPQTEDEIPVQYRLQCAAYALALGKTQCLLAVFCRASGLEYYITFDPEHYRKRIEDRIPQMLNAMRSPSLPLPQLPDWSINKRGTSWLCRYCRFAGCQANVNPYVTVRPDAVPGPRIGMGS